MPPTVTGFTRDRPPLAQASDYVELAQARFSPRVGLRFVTPTVFKLADGRHLPLPEPDLMIQGWARRWNAFCPPDLAFEEALTASVAGRFALAHAALETSLVDLGMGKLVGFTGAATFLALRPDAWPGAERVAFTALTAFSRFCGTGVRTTQGFGLTLPSS
jgi:CRISPR-associated endoribonuclease Cas6